MDMSLTRRRVWFERRDRQPEPKNPRIEDKDDRFDHANIHLKHSIQFYQPISFVISLLHFPRGACNAHLEAFSKGNRSLAFLLGLRE